MTVKGFLRTLLGLSTLAGCSLLYNPNNLPAAKVDAAPPPDTPTDINVEMPTLDDAGPAVLFEGQGTGGSRAAVLAVTGGNIGPDATIALAPTDGGPAPMIEIDNAHAVRSPSGSAMAVPITLAVDATRGFKDTPLTITVTQTGAMGTPVMVTLVGKVALRNLPELTTAITSSAALAPAYSEINVGGALTFAAAAGAPRAILHAYGSIALKDIHADASGGAAGPGGGSGGQGLSPGNPAVLLSTTASGAGYATSGGGGSGLNAAPGGGIVGDDFITDYRANAGSGGGANGNTSGGGGGGTLELTAGGTLTVGAITANGAGGSSIGGGSGGAIILRAGAKATLNGAITAAGGVSSNAGSGGAGRVRYEAPDLMGPPSIEPHNRRFVAFDDAAGVNLLITTNPRQTFQLVSAPSSTQFNLYVSNLAGTTTDSTAVTFGSPTAVVTPGVDLNFGYNRICVTSPTGNLTLPESTNCIDVAYVH